MPFFFPQQQQATLAQEQEEMDLFQLLSLLSAASSEEGTSKPQSKPQPQQQQQQQRFFSHCGPRRQHRQAPTFIPAFDILETGTAYELFGEVPGLDIKSLEVRFEDAQTLVLRGLTQRARPTAAAPVAEPQQEVVNEKAAEVEVKEDVKGKQASVEDDSEYDSVDTPLSSTATVAATETPAPAAAKTEQAPKPQQQPIRAKYWLAERKTGQFARSFSFAQRIEIDDVSAELKEGVLHVVVPKSVKSKKVEVVVV